MLHLVIGRKDFDADTLVAIMPDAESAESLAARCRSLREDTPWRHPVFDQVEVEVRAVGAVTPWVAHELDKPEPDPARWLRRRIRCLFDHAEIAAKVGVADFGDAAIEDMRRAEAPRG